MSLAIGDWVELAYAPGVKKLVVDIDPPYTCTPYPSVMLAWREGNKIQEGVVETKFVHKINNTLTRRSK